MVVGQVEMPKSDEKLLKFQTAADIFCLSLFKKGVLEYESVLFDLFNSILSFLGLHIV